LFLSFPISVTLSWWDSDHTRTGTPLQPIYSASYSSRSLSTSAGVALTVPFYPLLVTGSVRHAYNSNTRPAYVEAINPLATDFQTTPGEITSASQLIGDLRFVLPFRSGHIWVSAGYAYDLKRSPTEGDRDEVPLGAGVEFYTPRWLLGLSARASTGRDNIEQYSFSGAARLRF
jgi:hypothetical protein